jgi:hypothetical protein
MHHMAARAYVLREFSGACFLHDHCSRFGNQLTGGLRRIAEIPACPRRQHGGDVRRIGFSGQQVIGIVERDETFRMFGREKNLRRVVDVHRRIARPVKNDQRLAQVRDALLQVMAGDVIDELLADAKRASVEHDIGLPAGFDLSGRARLQEAPHVVGIEGRRDGRDGDRLRHLCGYCEHGCAPQAVPDQNFRRRVVFAEKIGRRAQVGDVG